MSTEAARAHSLAASIEALDWCAQIPHTVDQVVGIHGERIARSGRPLSRRVLTNDELIAKITGSTGGGPGGKGGHSDPTATAALMGEPDAVDDEDETITRITVACVDLDRHATEADHTVSDALHTDRWQPRTLDGSRTDLLRLAVVRLHHAGPNVEQAIEAMPRATAHHVDWLIRSVIAESAEWLHGKLRAIWLESRGETMPVAVQRALTVCRIHAQWVNDPPLADGGDGCCTQCDNFKRNHGCEPTQAIIDRWKWTKAATPALIIEAKAARRKGA